jgi:hypothetical protein
MLHIDGECVGVALAKNKNTRTKLIKLMLFPYSNAYAFRRGGDVLLRTKRNPTDMAEFAKELRE